MPVSLWAPPLGPIGVLRIRNGGEPAQTQRYQERQHGSLTAQLTESVWKSESWCNHGGQWRKRLLCEGREFGRL
ncbi:MAG: hypothetical protein AAFP90_06465 [Planctomycetota bacterium]